MPFSMPPMLQRPKSPLQTLPQYAPGHPKYAAPQGAGFKNLPQYAPGHPQYQPPGNAQVVQYAGAAQQPAPQASNSPAMAADYNRIGLQTPRFSAPYAQSNIQQSSGVGTTEGGYVSNQWNSRGDINTGRQFQYTPEQQAQIARDRQPVDAQWAMGTPAGYRGFGPGGQFANQQAQQQGGSMQNLPVGRLAGGSSYVAQAPDGRKVVIGSTSGVDPSTLGPRGRIGRDTGGDYKKLSRVDLELNRQRQIQQQDQGRNMLAENRRNRAIGKFGLSHLSPTYQYGPDPKTGVATGPLGAGGATGFGGGLASVPSAPSQLEGSLGFNPEGATIPDLGAAYTEKGGNWSQSQKDAFRKHIQDRLNGDEQFQNDFMDPHYYVDPSGNPWETPENIAYRNELRKLMGLPPLKSKMVERKWYE